MKIKDLTQFSRKLHVPFCALALTAVLGCGPAEEERTTPPGDEPQPAESIDDPAPVEDPPAPSASSPAAGAPVDAPSASTVQQAPAMPPGAAPGAPQGQDGNVEQMLQQARAAETELRQVTTQLRTAQQAAMEKEDVKTKLEALETAAVEAMAEQSPEARKDWDRARALVKELETNEELQKGDMANLSEETQAKVQEFQQLNQKLEPLQQKVAQDPKIQALQGEVAQMMEVAMKEIEPEFEALEQKRAELVSTLQSIQQAMIRQRMPQMMQQQGGQPQPPPSPTPAPSTPTPAPKPAPEDDQ